MDAQTKEEVRQGFADGIYHNPGYSLPCPNCNKSTTVFEEGSQWFCWACNQTFNQYNLGGDDYDEVRELEELLRLIGAV